MSTIPTSATDITPNIYSVLQDRSKAFAETLRTKGLDLPSATMLRNSVYTLRDGTGAPTQVLAYDSDSEDAPTVDEGLRSIRYKVSTPRKDRYGDVVMPKGCLAHLDNYRRNPQWFFSHNSSDIPIARVQHPQTKECTLEVLDDAMFAEAFYHCQTEESEVLYRLSAGGILQATSIGFLPVKASIIGSNKTEDEKIEEQANRRKEKTEDGEKVITFDGWMPLRFLEWDLLEISLVPLPANPDCVDALAATLSRGIIDGVKISPSLAKAFDLKARVWVHGFDPSKSKYTGTVKNGGSELEYDSGNLVRIDTFSLKKEESKPDATGTTPSQVEATLNTNDSPVSVEKEIVADVVAGAITLNEIRALRQTDAVDEVFTAAASETKDAATDSAMPADDNHAKEDPEAEEETTHNEILACVHNIASTLEAHITSDMNSHAQILRAIQQLQSMLSSGKPGTEGDATGPSMTDAPDAVAKANVEEVNARALLDALQVAQKKADEDNASMHLILQALETVKAGQARLDNKYFELTGREV